jgi:hypothetical protein
MKQARDLRLEFTGAKLKFFQLGDSQMIQPGRSNVVKRRLKDVARVAACEFGAAT